MLVVQSSHHQEHQVRKGGEVSQLVRYLLACANHRVHPCDTRSAVSMVAFVSGGAVVCKGCRGYWSPQSYQRLISIWYISAQFTEQHTMIVIIIYIFIIYIISYIPCFSSCKFTIKNIHSINHIYLSVAFDSRILYCTSVTIADTGLIIITQKLS